MRSGSTTERRGLADVLHYSRAGDVLVVWKLDRLGPSLSHLMAVIKQLHDRSVGFHSLSTQMDTSTGLRQLNIHVFGTLAEFE